MSLTFLRIFVAKGDFKKVAAAIKDLLNEEIEEFVKTGSIELEGHQLAPEDVRIIYQAADDDSK